MGKQISVFLTDEELLILKKLCGSDKNQSQVIKLAIRCLDNQGRKDTPKHVVEARVMDVKPIEVEEKSDLKKTEDKKFKLSPEAIEELKKLGVDVKS